MQVVRYCYSIFKEKLRKVMMPNIITSFVTCCVNIVSVRFATYFCLYFAGRWQVPHSPAQHQSKIIPVMGETQMMNSKSLNLPWHLWIQETNLSKCPRIKRRRRYVWEKMGAVEHSKWFYFTHNFQPSKALGFGIFIL
jgi:hypothetical protein